jgi:hypothetical protein
MTTTTFWKELFLHITIPFEINDVKEISCYEGSMWIEMKDGAVYYICFESAGADRA